MDADQSRLVRLKMNVVEIPLRGKKVAAIIERGGGPRGLFRKADSVIRLRSGRGVQETLFTLCHEIGHFWSWATGRRLPAYEEALKCHQRWADRVTIPIREALCARGFEPKESPPDIYNEVKLAICEEWPYPLKSEESLLIYSEEELAWTFGFLLATKLGCAQEEFCVEVTSALNVYSRNMFLPERARWDGPAADFMVTEDEEAFLDELVGGQVPSTRNSISVDRLPDG